MEIVEKIKSIVSQIEADAKLFYEKGNKSAGTRTRVLCQDLKNLAQELRLNIQDVKNAKKD